MTEVALVMLPTCRQPRRARTLLPAVVASATLGAGDARAEYVRPRQVSLDHFIRPQFD